MSVSLNAANVLYMVTFLLKSQVWWLFFSEYDKNFTASLKYYGVHSFSKRYKEIFLNTSFPTKFTVMATYTFHGLMGMLKLELGLRIPPQGV